MSFKNDMAIIIAEALAAVRPEEAVDHALKELRLNTSNIYVVAIGKAAWRMAKEASQKLTFKQGIVVTKYGHSNGEIKGFKIYEAGHPIPDENSLKASRKIIEMVADLRSDDHVLLLLSGGASALFEMPLIPLNELQEITNELLRNGANINEINIVRKHLSKVKGGNFAKICAPAIVHNIILSDVLDNDLSTIGSGIAYPDKSGINDAIKIIDQYGLKLDKNKLKETAKSLNNITVNIGASVKDLCLSAFNICRKLGYKTTVLNDTIAIEAREAGYYLAGYANEKGKRAFILTGETVVHVSGKGKGGRNQELVLAAADKINGKDNVFIFSIGSDGTDGPTEAAGAYADGETVKKMALKGIDADEYLLDNNSYEAFKAIGQLIITGPTGTNVNDLSVLLINREV